MTDQPRVKRALPCLTKLGLSCGTRAECRSQETREEWKPSRPRFHLALALLTPEITTNYPPPPFLLLYASFKSFLAIVYFHRIGLRANTASKMRLFDRSAKTAPSHYPKFLFHGVRTVQLISSIIVGGVMSYFMYHLTQDHWQTPWTFIWVRETPQHHSYCRALTSG